jgi:hypothetical protein
MNSTARLDADLKPTSRSFLRRLYNSRWTFAGLQLLDLLTTLAAFHFGAFEVNPLVAQLTFRLGRFGGVLMSKLIAVLIALRVKRLVWVVNVFYTIVILWNIIVLVALSAPRH